MMSLKLSCDDNVYQNWICYWIDSFLECMLANIPSGDVWLMHYVQVIFEGGPKQTPRRITQVPYEPGKRPEHYESMARSLLAEFDAVCYIPAWDYKHDQYSDERNLVKMTMQPTVFDDVRPENHALWCEDGNGHAFSAKDPEKATITVRGEAKLVCGECLSKRFTPKAISD